jgi:hypothetical protein
MIYSLYAIKDAWVILLVCGRIKSVSVQRRIDVGTIPKRNVKILTALVRISHKNNPQKEYSCVEVMSFCILRYHIHQFLAGQEKLGSG